MSEKTLDKILSNKLQIYYSKEHVGLITLEEKKKLYASTMAMFKQMQRKDLFDKMLNA